MTTPSSRKGPPPRSLPAMDSAKTLHGYDGSTPDPIASPADLQDLVDRFGEDLSSWPLELRAPAEEFIDASDEARAIIAQARRLRQQLRRLGPKAPACIVDRILSVAIDCDPPLDDVCRLRN